MTTEGEWERLIKAAQRALSSGKVAEFVIDGRAAEVAKAEQIDLTKLRYSILSEAFRLYIDGLATPHRSNGDP